MEEIEIRRLIEEGPGVSGFYHIDGVVGYLNAWKLKSEYIFTWEEMREDDFYNEHNWLKDQRDVFQKIDDLIEHFDKIGVNLAIFTRNPRG